jgi:hypothetical protein
MSICLTLSNKVSDDSWKTNIPLIDGFGTEGIGSMMQCHLLLKFYADFLGVDFTYSGSTNFSHHSYSGYSEYEYLNLIDTFFNFPNLKNQWDEVINITDMNDGLFSLIEDNKNTNKKILINLSNCHIQLSNICHQKFSELFTQERIDIIRNSLIFNGKKYFDENINISLHIRTSNPNDIPSEIVSPSRELYVFRKDFYRYKNLINYLKKNTEKQKTILHIHSQGFATNFEEFLKFKTDDFDVHLHIDDPPASDLYHMSNADLLIMSNSSFSWIASLLNSNQKIVRDNFTNGPFVHNALKANYDYTEIL